MSEELNPVEVADEIKAVMEDEKFIPSPEDIECYGKHQIKPSEILPCPFCGAEYLQFGDWGTHGAYDKVSCGNGCTDWVPVERWNNRPSEEVLQKRIAEQETENREQLIDYENRLCEARKYQQDAVKRCEEFEQERNKLEAERDRLREALRGLMRAVDGCLTPSEVEIWQKCVEALEGTGE